MDVHVVTVRAERRDERASAHRVAATVAMYEVGDTH
jgi:hypothetical protein